MKLRLSATDPAVATVIASNTSEKDAIEGLQLTAVGESAAAIKPQPPQLLMPEESLVYQVSVPAWSVPSPPSELALLAKFTFKGIKRAVATSITRTEPEPLEVEKLATVEVKASLATLRSDQAEPVYLLIRNRSALPLTVRRIVPNSPGFITFSGLPRNVEVDAGRTRVLRLEAKAGSRVQSGEHQLVFRLPVEIDEERFDLTASQATDVGVAGEAELLGALGITSLLLLPGILAGATASLLWRLRWLRPSWEAGEFPVTPKDVEFWVLAGLFSIGFALLWSWLVVDLFDAYGLRDLLVLWIASVAVGFLLYTGVKAGMNAVRAKRVPDANDDPITLLRKLVRQGLDLRRRSIPYTTASGEAQLFLVQPEQGEPPAKWLSPAITYRWAAAPDTALNERIQHALDRSHDAAALADALEEGERRRLLAVSFDRSGGIAKPILLAKDKVVALSGSEPFVKEEE